MKLRKYLVFILVAIFFSSFKPQPTSLNSIHWVRFDQLAQKMKDKPKLILVHFYTPWCGYCKRMAQTTFQNQKVINYLNKYFYVVDFNAESKQGVLFNGEIYKFNANYSYRRNGAHELVIYLLDSNIVYPSDVILDVNYQIIEVKRGSSNVEHYLKLLEDIVNEHV